MEKYVQWEYFKEKFKSLSKALKIQAKEYERRLGELNHEAERIKQVQKDSIPREVFDREKDALTAKFERAIETTNQKFDRLIEEMKIAIEKNTSSRTEQVGKIKLLNFIPWIISAIISIAALIFMWLTYSKK